MEDVSLCIQKALSVLTGLVRFETKLVQYERTECPSSGSLVHEKLPFRLVSKTKVNRNHLMSAAIRQVLGSHAPGDSREFAPNCLGRILRTVIGR